MFVVWFIRFILVGFVLVYIENFRFDFGLLLDLFRFDFCCVIILKGGFDFFVWFLRIIIRLERFWERKRKKIKRKGKGERLGLKEEGRK